MKPAARVLTFALQAVLATADGPRWEAMVINLERRPDRLHDFGETLRRKQPWIYNGHLCRIQGRDGRDLPRDSSAPHGQRSASFLERRPRGGAAGAVPWSLWDTSQLVGDGWVTADALRAAQRPLTRWPNMTAGGIGLFLGHAGAWQHVVDAGLDFGLVFEDDLTLFARGFSRQVSDILEGREDTHASWDWLYLQRCGDKSWDKERSYWDSDDERASQHMDAGWSSETLLAADASVPCTGAYIVTNTGARKLLEGALPASEQLDHQLTSVPGLTRAALSPPLAQCAEVRKNSAGSRYRDTDVQMGESLNTQLQTIHAESLSKWLDSSSDPDSTAPALGQAKDALSSALSAASDLKGHGHVVEEKLKIPECGAV